MAVRAPFLIGGTEVRAGRRAHVELPVSRLITGAQMSMPVTVLHGRDDGPKVWINAAIHGDELNGVEVVNRVLSELDPKTMNGTLLAVPVVNIHGFITGDRYLPDRRDLNRSFPGSAKGSLAARLAYMFMTEIVQHCELGIDLHTASDNRTNLPQIRADLNDPRTKELAEVFGARLMMHSKDRAGSLRHAGTKAGALVLLYEAGEPLRFNNDAISSGVDGVRRVLRHLNIAKWDGPAATPVAESRSSAWARCQERSDQTRSRDRRPRRSQAADGHDHRCVWQAIEHHPSE
jgi:predicted deacylase